MERDRPHKLAEEMSEDPRREPDQFQIWLFGDPAAQAAIAAAIAAHELGPSDDPERMLVFSDLVPEEWIGGTETRQQVAERLLENLAYAVASKLSETRLKARLAAVKGKA